MKELIFRPYVMQAVAGSRQIFQGPCVVDAIFTTSQPVGETWILFDGLGPSGSIINESNTPNALQVRQFGLMMRLTIGLFLVQTGVPPFAWTFSIAAL